MKTLKEAKGEGVLATAKLIDAFRDQLAASRQSLPSVRCLPHSRLIELLLDARETVDSTILRECPGTQLIQLLEDAAVIRAIPLQPASSKKSVKLYSVGFDPTAATIPAAELLQAHVPEGILCYFTAIELHGLSTQPAPHYHIALKKAADPKRKVPLPKVSPSSDRPLPLGTLEFYADGVGYYRTRRDPANLLSVQRRQLNPYCVVRVTTLEQTLLDCLHRPHSAGGAAVVFEAWEQGLTRSSPEKILTLAEKIGDKTLLRRTGYMIERFAPQSDSVQKAKRLIGSIPQDAMPTLLPGLAYQHANREWGLRTP
ncbi:hypothetical protein [Frateuria sp. Soil773]|uniref:type IV toxin-antitoxin system AbiEi family antitoxin domain-containing protein n=1 Tax=Frateuria sp. Soil773 TaxID=1736407 RepID=UPI0012FAF1F5|nr:hypothetical protein [Frateuria sp. Soil773]